MTDNNNVIMLIKIEPDDLQALELVRVKKGLKKNEFYGTILSDHVRSLRKKKGNRKAS